MFVMRRFVRLWNYYAVAPFNSTPKCFKVWSAAGWPPRGEKGSRSSCRAVHESLSYSLRWDLFLMAKPFRCFLLFFFMSHRDSDKRSFGSTSLIFSLNRADKADDYTKCHAASRFRATLQLVKDTLVKPAILKHQQKTGRTPLKDFLFNHNSCWTYKTDDQADDLTKLPHAEAVCVLWGLSWWGKVPPAFQIHMELAYFHFYLLSVWWMPFARRHFHVCGIWSRFSQ